MMWVAVLIACVVGPSGELKCQLQISDPVVTEEACRERLIPQMNSSVLGQSFLMDQIKARRLIMTINCQMTVGVPPIEPAYQPPAD